ncbi:MAG: hypothetical protein U1B30_08785 [Pseudomonadota bacterium]|nr:hypothetical protein [Pseudomonadota bacterium]
MTSASSVAAGGDTAASPAKACCMPPTMRTADGAGINAGLAKIITTPKGKLLGAAIAGVNAGELVHEYVLAIAKGRKAADLSGIIHIYPSLAQINRRVADARLKEGLTPTAKKWIRRIFCLRGEG